MAIVVASAWCLLASPAEASVSTRSGNNARTGEYQDSTGNLHPSKVSPSSFGRLWTYLLDGLVYAQPLTADNVVIPNVGTKNIVVFATDNDSVWIYDADSSTFIQDLYLGYPFYAFDCDPGNFSNYRLGIYGTPVISGTTMYLVAESVPSPGSCVPTHTLYSINVATGSLNLLPDGGVASTPLSATVNGTNFNSYVQIQRAGLLLQNGTVYIAFAGNNDKENYYGWVLAYDATTLAQKGAFCSACGSTTQYGEGIWQGGAGLVGDGASSNDVYAFLGNTVASASQYSEAAVKLSSSLGVVAANQTSPSLDDTDLASGGPILVQNVPGTQPSTLLIGGGKTGVVYLFDPTQTSSLPQINGQYNPILPNNILASPVSWQENNFVYFWTANDTLRRYTLSSNVLTSLATSTVPALPQTDEQSFGSAYLSLSRNTGNGNAIVWANVPIEEPTTLDIGMKNGNPRYPEARGRGILRAVDANTLNPLWHSDRFYFARFNVPTVAYGRVYVPTFDAYCGSCNMEVRVYGPQTSSPRLSGIAVTGISSWTTVPLARSQGDGSYAVTNPSVSTFPARAAAASHKMAGDFNGDGFTDLAVIGDVNHQNDIPLALSSPGGNFTFQDPSTGSNPFSFWVTCSTAQSLVGNFAGTSTSDIALVGCNGWSTLPLARSSVSQGTVSFNVTNNSFSSSFQTWASNPAVTVLTGNFDGVNAAGKSTTDIALMGTCTSGINNSGIPMAFSNGDGTFALTNVSPSPAFGSWACQQGGSPVPLVGDFNGDGKADLALIGGIVWDTIPVALSTSTSGDQGTFNVVNDRPTPAAPNTLPDNFLCWATTPGAKFVVGDFNGDGISDIAMVGASTQNWTDGTAPNGCHTSPSHGCNSIPVAFGSSTGQFNVVNVVVTPGWTTAHTNMFDPNGNPLAGWCAAAAQPGVVFLTGDFDGDGRTDIALRGPYGTQATHYWQTLPIALSNGDGSFTVTHPLVTNQPTSDFPGWAEETGAVPLVGVFQ